MKKHSIKIAGREFPLAFSLNTMIRLQDENPNFDYTNMENVLKTPKGLVDMLYCLALSGVSVNDQTLDVSKEWMAERLPATLEAVQKLGKVIVDTIAAGRYMETEEQENKDREVDVVLEEIKKKEEKTDRPGVR